MIGVDGFAVVQSLKEQIEGNRGPHSGFDRWRGNDTVARRGRGMELAIHESCYFVVALFLFMLLQEPFFCLSVKAMA